MSGWISVQDKLPQDNEVVIGYTPRDGYIFIGFYHKDPLNERRPGIARQKEWFLITSMRSTQRITKRVTHWMPLPERPETDERV